MLLPFVLKLTLLHNAYPGEWVAYRKILANMQDPGLGAAQSCTFMCNVNGLLSVADSLDYLIALEAKDLALVGLTTLSILNGRHIHRFGNGQSFGRLASGKIGSGAG